MVDNVCNFLIKKMKKEMPSIDDEETEVIKYGLELIIGEIPKIVILFIIAFILHIGWYVLFSYITMLPYKIVAGGFHLKTNIGCFIAMCIVYLGNVILSQYLKISPEYLKYIIVSVIWILSMVMIKLYAPADTINLPILRRKERIIKKILSYIIATSTLLIAVIINNNVLSNILIINVTIESFFISRLAYKITRNEYGYEVYAKQDILV